VTCRWFCLSTRNLTLHEALTGRLQQAARAVGCGEAAIHEAERYGA